MLISEECFEWDKRIKHNESLLLWLFFTGNIFYWGVKEGIPMGDKNPKKLKKKKKVTEKEKEPVALKEPKK